MKTYIERTLVNIRETLRDKRIFVSTDIYYDDLAIERGEEFVVRVYAGNDLDRHFRTNHIRKSLKQALEFVKGL